MTLWQGQDAYYDFGWTPWRRVSRTSIVFVQLADSPPWSCGIRATDLYISIVLGHAEFAALSRLGLGLLVAGQIWPSRTSVQTMAKDGLGSGPQVLGGGRGALGGGFAGGSVASCPWRPPGRGLCLCFLQPGRGDQGCGSRSGRGSRLGHARLALVHSAAAAGRQISQASRPPPLPRRYKPVPLHGRIR